MNWNLVVINRLAVRPTVVWRQSSSALVRAKLSVESSLLEAKHSDDAVQQLHSGPIESEERSQKTNTDHKEQLTNKSSSQWPDRSILGFDFNLWILSTQRTNLHNCLFYFDTFFHLSQLNGDLKCTVGSTWVLSSHYAQNKRQRITKIKQNTDTFTEHTNSHLSLAVERVEFCAAFFRFSEAVFVTIRERSCCRRVLTMWFTIPF